MKTENINPTAAIHAAISGDRKSQRELYDRYNAKMFAICLRYTKNKMDAEDVLQNGFLKMFLNLGKFRHEGFFDGWVRRLFVNECINHLRLNKNLEDIDIFENSITHNTENGFNKLCSNDLKKHIKELSTGYKACFALINEGYSHKEIAESLGISVATSKSQYYRARKKLMQRV